MTALRFSWSRDLLCLVAVAAASVLQASVFDHLAVGGVVPDLVLLVVIAVALAHGTEYGCLVGFGAGLLLDLAPPADGVAGRWALSLLVVGYVAGRLRAGRPESARRRLALVALVAACSFIGTSIFALTGVVLGDHAVAVPDLLRVVGTAALYDLGLGLLVVPVVVRVLGRVSPEQVLLA